MLKYKKKQQISREYVILGILKKIFFSKIFPELVIIQLNLLSLHCAKSLQLYLTLCDPMDCNLPGSSVHGTLQARTLDWVAISYSKGSSNPGIEPVSLMSPALAGEFFTTSTTWEAPLKHFCTKNF